MKLLLLQPPLRDFYTTDIRLHPFGLCMLKAVLRQRLPEVEVRVRDFHHGHGRQTVPLPPALRYLGDYYEHADKSAFSTFHQFYHFGASFETVGSAAAAENPDLIGISCLFTPYAAEALACARECRQRTTAPVVLGGSHVTAAPEQVLQDPAVEYVIRGEGERPLVALVQALQTGSPLDQVPNLGFKRDGQLIFTPMEPNYELATLPWPDFSDFPVDRYACLGRPMAFVAMSRGCPHRCAFCSVGLTFGHRHRRRSPDDVFAEVCERYAQGFRVFDFEDDNLSVGRADFVRLLELLATTFPPGALQLLAMNGLSSHDLDPGLLELMRQAGFSHLNLALVSASAATLRRLKRPHCPERFQQIAHLAHVLGFMTVAYGIIGLPCERVEDMIATLALLARLPLRIGASVYYAAPGSELAAADGISGPDDFLRARSTAMSVETEAFRRDDVFTLFTAARILNFFKETPTNGEHVGLSEALRQAEATGGRAGLSAALYKRLQQEQRLYAATKSGQKVIRHFDARLWARVAETVGEVRTLDGGWIDLRSS